jgi:dolichol kinase
MSERIVTQSDPNQDESRTTPRRTPRQLLAAKRAHLTPDPETIRSWREGVEWDRKGIHLSSTLLAFWTFYMDEPLATGGLIVATLFVLAVDRARLSSRRWGLWMYRKFPFVFRVDERHDFSGASVMMIGATLTSALFSAGPATAGILCLTWGDSAAALVGQLYSHWRLRKRQRAGERTRSVAVRKRRHKTLAGTLGCLFVSMLMILLVMGPLPVVIVFGGLAAALMERWTHGRWDNLTMPLASAGVIHYSLTWLR